ncbi:hypothetical protein D9C11_05190 [Bacillus subtilis subsp. subtilis]|nr:hypothetical protein D9C11_05190 [Bacillus subtilis subsp. subtilis]
MGALFLNLKPGEYLKKQYKTKKLVEKTSFSLQAEPLIQRLFHIIGLMPQMSFAYSRIVRSLEKYPE